MKPRRTVESNQVFRLAGGTEDNDLWAQVCVDRHGNPLISSVWQPSAKEREAIAAGANIELLIWGGQQPPVAVSTTTVELGRGG